MMRCYRRRGATKHLISASVEQRETECAERTRGEKTTHTWHLLASSLEVETSSIERPVVRVTITDARGLTRRAIAVAHTARVNHRLKVQNTRSGARRFERSDDATCRAWIATVIVHAVRIPFRCIKYAMTCRVRPIRSYQGTAVSSRRSRRCWTSIAWRCSPSRRGRLSRCESTGRISCSIASREHGSYRKCRILHSPVLIHRDRRDLSSQRSIGITTQAARRVAKRARFVQRRSHC
jgi:hypothetical protein